MTDHAPIPSAQPYETPENYTDRLALVWPEDQQKINGYLLWRAEPSEKPGEKPRKVPYYTNGVKRNGTQGSPQDRKRLASFSDAIKAFDAGNYTGIGLAMLPEWDLTAVDLDSHGKPVDAKLSKMVIETTYAERSPGLDGIRGFYKGRYPRFKNAEIDIEIFDETQFVTITGDVLNTHGVAEISPLVKSKLDAINPNVTPPNASTATATSNVVDIVDIGMGVPEGDRNCACARIAGHFAHQHCGDFDATLVDVLNWNQLNAPPMGEREVRQTVKSICRKERNKPTTSVALSRKYMCTDTGNSERFADQHAGRALYCHPWNKWQVYDGKRWSTDVAGHMQRLAKQTVRSIYAEAPAEKDKEKRKAIASWAAKSEAKKNRKDMLELAQSEPCFPVQPEELDADPWLLNVQNGTIDLKTGNLLSHNPRHLITKIVPVVYDKDAKAPRWEQFIQEVVEPDVGTFLQRAAGYTLTGDTSEKCLFNIYGERGNNGKTVYQNMLAKMLGDYAKTAEFETFLQTTKSGGSASEDIARLAGARLVVAGEAHDKRKINSVLIKRLTGRDTITCRRLHEGSFEYQAHFKIWLAGNSRPQIKAGDNALWDRLRLIDFNRTFVGKNQDKELEDKLTCELPGILAWAIRGLMDWHKMGLGEPVEVLDSVRDYRGACDYMQLFINDRCNYKIGGVCHRKKVYAVFCEWWPTFAEGNAGDGFTTDPMDSDTFGKEITKYGIEPGGKRRIEGERDRTWVGIEII